MITWRDAFGYIDWSVLRVVHDSSELFSSAIPERIDTDDESAKWIAANIEEATNWPGQMFKDFLHLRGKPISETPEMLGSIFKYIPNETSFDDMNLPTPLYNVLRRNGFATFGQISEMKFDDFRRIRNFGIKMLKELKIYLVIYQAVWFRYTLTAPQPTETDDESPTDEIKLPLDPMDLSWIDNYTPIHSMEINAGLNQLALYLVLTGREAQPLFANSEELPAEFATNPIFKLSAKDWLGPVVIPDLQDILFGLFEHWNENELKVLNGRFLARNTKTLEAIGDSLGLTRERIRQLDKKIQTDYSNFLDSNWILRALLQSLQNFTAEPKTRTQLDKSGINLDFTYAGKKIDLVDFFIGMGELEARDQWVCSDFSSFETLFDNIWDTVSGDGVSVEATKFEDAYEGSGLNRSRKFMQNWLEYSGYSKFRKHWYLKVGKSLPDLAEVILKIRGEGMTSEQIFEAIESNKSIRSLHNSLITSEKFTKLSKHSWGLAEWNLESYEGIRESIMKYVEEKGSVSLSSLKKTFVEKFGVKASSVETYAQSYPLQVADGMVSKAPERTSNTHRKTVSQTRNMYEIASGVSLRIKINREHLRGSGSPCPAALAAFLNLAPLEKRKLSWKHGTFMVSDQGAVTNLPSIRPACEDLGVGLGEELLLIFEKNTVRAEKLCKPDKSTDYIKQLCQVDDSVQELRGLRKALQLKDTEPDNLIIEKLVNRKENDLLELVTRLMGR